MPRRILFTLNNPLPEEISKLREFPEHSQFRFLCFQGEVGEKGTPHLQGYLEITKNQRQSFFKKLIPRAHIEFAKGDSEDNIHYCSKPHPSCVCDHCTKANKEKPNWLAFEKYGTPAKDVAGAAYWEKMVELVKDNTSDLEILEVFPKALPHLSHLDKLRQVIQLENVSNKDITEPNRLPREIRVIWLWGSAGIGKTYSVWKKHPDLYTVADYKHPFDLYYEQKTILWDDFYPINFQTLLKYLDIYPVQLPCRYNNKWACWNNVYITSNTAPLLLYPNLTFEEKCALVRRINIVKVVPDKDFERAFILQTLHKSKFQSFDYKQAIFPDLESLIKTLNYR